MQTMAKGGNEEQRGAATLISLNEKCLDQHFSVIPAI